MNHDVFMFLYNIHGDMMFVPPEGKTSADKIEKLNLREMASIAAHISNNILFDILAKKYLI